MNAEMAEKENNKPEEVKEEIKEEGKASETPNDAAGESTNKTETDNTVEPSSTAVSNLRLLENIEVKLTVEVGNTEIKINMRRSYVDQSYLSKLETSITKGTHSLNYGHQPKIRFHSKK